MSEQPTVIDMNGYEMYDLAALKDILGPERHAQFMQWLVGKTCAVLEGGRQLCFKLDYDRFMAGRDTSDMLWMPPEQPEPEPEPGQRAYDKWVTAARHAIDEQGNPHEEPPWGQLDATEKMAWVNVERQSRGGRPMPSGLPREAKSLGQVAYESWQLPTGSYRSAAEWQQERADMQARYQAQAEAVRDEVLRSLARSATVADAQRTVTPGERAYDLFQKYTWDNSEVLFVATAWGQLSQRDQANWEKIAHPDDTLGVSADDASDSAAGVTLQQGYVLQAHAGHYWHVVQQGDRMVAREYPVGTEPTEEVSGGQ